MVEVNILGRNDSTYLVEWEEDNKFYRSFIPVESVYPEGQDGKVYCNNPHIGVPYGVSWSMFVDEMFPVEDFENELHRKGIWTLEDLKKHPDRATSALQRILGSVVSKMRLRVIGEE